MPFFLGIDAGGTRTEAAIAGDHVILARASAGSIKTLRVSPGEAERNLDELLGELTKRAAVSPNALAATCLGISGYTLSSVTGWARAALSARVTGSIEVCGDTEIALDAAFPGGSGVLVIAGTGTNVLARTTTGELLGVGGYGPLLGDQGSGHWIGLEAIRRSLHAHDRGQPAPLLRAIAAAWGVESSAQAISDVMSHAYASRDPQFSVLAPAVYRAAMEGDTLATQLLADAGRALADDAAVAVARLHAADPESSPKVAFTGSILREIAPVRDTFMAELRRLAPSAQVVPEAVDPVDGALWRARQAGARS